MAEAQFPPPAQIPMSIRMQEIENTRFLAVRKAASEIYLNPDNTPLMSYGDTLLDRQKVKDAVLAFELSKGWVVDDRGTAATPQAIVAPPAAPAQTAVPVIGFAAPGQIPAPPTGAVVLQAPPQMQVPVAPPQMAQPQFNGTVPAPQAPPSDAPMEMPVGKARRGRPAALGTSVAPPPPPPGAVHVVQMQAPQLPVIPPPQQASPLPLPMPMGQPQAAAPSVDVGALAKVFGEFAQVMEKQVGGISGDFKQFVSNLSAQINETNKALAEIQATQKKLADAQTLQFVALHHLYMATVRLPEGVPPELAKFSALLMQYVPR